MCRLFGFRARHPTSVSDFLLHGPSSLAALSREHGHGWGIASAETGGLRVQRSSRAAHEDDAFAARARNLASPCVLAHIRRRSTGGYALEDAHPFHDHGLAFAHNGTIQHFELARPRIEAAIAPELRSRVRGGTDSERCFYLFLTRLAHRGVLDAPRLEHLVTTLADTVAWLAELPCPAARPHALNFLVTDGRNLVAVRHGSRELYWTHAGAADTAIESVAIASEPLTKHHAWIAVPDRHIVAIDAQMNPDLLPLGSV